MREKKKSLRPVARRAKKTVGKRKDGPRGEGAPSGEPPPAPPQPVDPPRGGRRR